MCAQSLCLPTPDQFYWMFPLGTERKCMAFIATAVDESADKGQRHIFAVAGLCWRHDKWIDLEWHWNRCLKKHGIDYFKTSEYLRLDGEFLRFRNNTDYPPPSGRRAAEEIFAELAQIIRTSGVKGVGLAIDLKAWRSIMKSSTAKKVFYYKDPYVFGHAALVVYVAGELTGNIRGRMVSFLLDYHCKGKLVLNQMGDLKKFNPECAPYIGSIGFNDDKTTAQLQAADLIAGVSKNYALNELGQMPGDKEANKKALVGILGRSVGVGVLDHAYLTKVAKASGLSKGRPSIYSTLQRHLFE
jgi:hypothetical protein